MVEERCHLVEVAVVPVIAFQALPISFSVAFVSPCWQRDRVGGFGHFSSEDGLTFCPLKLSKNRGFCWLSGNTF